tara:strand:- start:1955 stop:2896 length:942 start_codon:yes stop_codon:yes gene_type:complete
LRLIRNIKNFPHDILRDGSILTIGAFDGIHIGHQVLLNEIRKISNKNKLPTIVMSFEPTPAEFFLRSKSPSRLMRFREKYEALEKLGIDIFFCPKFDKKMQNINADDFIRMLLIQKLNIKHLIIGDDFHFARNREGSFDHLERSSKALGFELKKISSVVENDKRVSSTLIRKYLHSGNLAEAARYLGKPFRMSGKVIKGEQLGRKLGYPTANVSINRIKTPIMGIFAVKIYGLSQEPLEGVASLGMRPTFYEKKKPLLEVHIFDFDRDIYGHYIQVDFLHKIRDEEKFVGSEALIEQMHLDSDAAKKVFKQSN